MVPHLSEAERAFYEDVREKKKAALGVHSKTGKNGYTGKILFPSDIMSRKDKYNHRKAGRIVSSNIFDEILTVDEFRELETHEKKNRMQYWREKYSNKEIQKAMGIANSPYYKIIADLDLPKAPRTERTKRSGAGKKTPKKSLLDFAEEAAAAPPAPKEEEAPAPVQEVVVDGLHLVFNGTYKADHIQKQFEKFSLLIDGDEEDYYLEFKLMQKVNK